MQQKLHVLTSAIAIVTLLATSSGCSFIFVKTPPADGRIVKARAGDCTSSRLAPGFDTAFGTLQLVRTAMAAAAPDRVYEDPNQPLSRGADIGLGVGFAALFVGSAVYGFVNTSRCSRLRANLDSDTSTSEEPAEKWQPTASASPSTPVDPAPTAAPAPASMTEPAAVPEPPAAESPAPETAE
jgi:hypothetical protein